MFGNWKHRDTGGRPAIQRTDVVMFQRANESYDQARARGGVDARDVTWAWAAGGSGDDVIAYCVKKTPAIYRMYGQAKGPDRGFTPLRKRADTHILEMEVLNGEITRTRIVRVEQ